ncbi:type I secretion system permease/ATPase [Saccharobesus litoralis]|uniref:Type I secretion system permease/ATPase n=1 Tax=Saccharobesus litoralis TaxID=2172099 RepID=A0A2S0VRX2_9ALTE|nr:type I secretion system permease/ATPase [Saccharobesus litoralis]AWB66957.1 type I secretion system permease/ATPase [Saccharobesus litoralis]
MENHDRLKEQLEIHTEFQDPLLNSLAFLTKYYGKPFSNQSLAAGLPLIDGKLTPELFPRAALRGGLDAKLVKKSITDIPALLLPCVLLLRDGRCCVLLSRDKDKIQIAWPELEGSHDEIELSALDELYTGFTFYVRKKYRFDERSKETLTTTHGHWFWDTLGRSIPIYRDALIAALFINLFAIASPLFVMNVYDRVVPNLAVDTLWVLTIGMVIVMIFDFGLKELRSHLLDLAAKKSDILLSAKLFEKVLNINMANRPASVGAFARNIQDFDSIRDFITSATIAALIDVPFSILFIFIIMLVAGPLAIVPLLAIIAMLAYSFWIKGKIRVEVERGARFSVQKNAHLIETLTGIESLKLAGAESQFQQKWEDLVGHISNWNLAIRKYGTSVSTVTGFITQLSTVFIVVVGVYQIMEGNISMGAMIAGVMLTGRALAPFAQVALLATRYNQAESALTALEEVMQQPDENFDRYLHRPYIEGAIQFSRVNFAYPNTEYNVLNNINLGIKPKEKVAIIGRIGAGKTTIEKLLLSFYQPQQGSIRLDGVDINQISPADLRQKIGCLPQDISLFYGSIRENITLGVPHVEDERILRAARLAGVTSFTDVDPEGLDRQVGERGAFLSGGQRQAVALARALLFNPPILVLDEPTSNMDNHSEQLVKQKLALLAQDKTLILITHKFSMLDLADRVIVMERGSIVADGPKDAVMQALREGKIKAPS